MEKLTEMLSIQAKHSSEFYFASLNAILNLASKENLTYDDFVSEIETLENLRKKQVDFLLNYDNKKSNHE